MLVVDRFEGDMAVCIDGLGHVFNIPSCMLPGAREGDVIRELSGGAYSVDNDATQSRRSEMKARTRALFSRRNDDD